jgi:transposase
LQMEIVLSAILFVLSEGCTWRGIDQPDANWNSVYRYYRRWCRNGVWNKVWEVVAPSLDCKTVFIDSTHIKVHRCGLNPSGGREAQAIGKTKGGWNTKIHGAVNQRGVPLSLLLSPGNEADISHAEELVDKILADTLAADKGYDSDDFRIWLFERDVTPCIPAKSNRIDPLPYNKKCYRKRHLIENFFASIKTFRRVATRYDKLAETFFGWVMLAVSIKFGF